MEKRRLQMAGGFSRGNPGGDSALDVAHIFVANQEIVTAIISEF